MEKPKPKPLASAHMSVPAVIFLGLMAGLGAAWFFGVVWAFFALLVYGLAGLEWRPPSPRAFALVFSASFLVATAGGLVSWVRDRLEKGMGQ